MELGSTGLAQVMKTELSGTLEESAIKIKLQPRRVEGDSDEISNQIQVYGWVKVDEEINTGGTA